MKEYDQELMEAKEAVRSGESKDWKDVAMILASRLDRAEGKIKGPIRIQFTEQERGIIAGLGEDAEMLVYPDEKMIGQITCRTKRDH